MTHMIWMLVLAAALGCDEGDPCDEYVDYICDCHPDEDCDSLQNTYAGADAELQDACVIALDEQLEADDESGLTCGDTGL